MPPRRNAPKAEDLRRLIRELLPEETVVHSIGTAELMSSLAEEAGFSVEQAVTAGLLHDIAKPMKRHELAPMAEAFGLAITDLQRQNPKLLHGPVGAEMCRRTLGIEDEDVYEAIYWHTTGRPQLGKLGQATYLADFAEPSRTHAEAAKARAMLASDGFDKALLFVASKKLEHIRAKAVVVDPAGEAFLAWLLQRERP